MAPLGKRRGPGTTGKAGRLIEHLLRPGHPGASSGDGSSMEAMTMTDRCTYHIIVEGSLEVKLPTIWTDEKQSREEAERRERLEERRSEEKE